MLNDVGIVENVLMEIFLGKLGHGYHHHHLHHQVAKSNQTRVQKKLPMLDFIINHDEFIEVVRAFQARVCLSIQDMQAFQSFLMKLFKKLEELLKKFMVFIIKQSKCDPK
jgi:hypothetical protein